MAGADAERRRLRVPVPARHGRAALRAGRRRRSPKASSAGRAASMRRSARTRRCSPTWCAACSKTAPTPRSSTASPTPRCRSTSWSPIRSTTVERIAARKRRERARRAASGDRAAARDLRRRAPQLERPRPCRTKTRRCCGRLAPTRCNGQRARCWRRATRHRGSGDGDGVRLHGVGSDARCATRPTATTSSATCVEATPPTSSAPLASAAERAAPAGRRRRRPSAPRCSSAPPTACEARHAGAARPARARGRQDLLPTRIAEVREAVDFLRYYAAQARRDARRPRRIVPLGPVVCISPWNFPLAIFTGQVAAALAAGNPVLAKPAEQTPLIAAEAVRLPARRRRSAPARCSCCPAAAKRSAPRSSPTRASGVMFTGSTDVARLLQRALADRARRRRPSRSPLIAETGGQNAMIVDSSALAEQVVADVVASAFDSAGQRCSALRVLCLQDDVADRVARDAEGRDGESSARRDRAPRRRRRAGDRRRGARRDRAPHRGDARARPPRAPGRCATTPARRAHGTFVAPTLIEIDRLAELEREVFGPVLHVLRYRRARTRRADRADQRAPATA